MLSPKIAAVAAASMNLLKLFRNTDISYTMSYNELVDAAAAANRCPNDQQICDFLDSAEAFIQDLDDRSKSSSPEWQDLTDAIDDARELPMAA